MRLLNTISMEFEQFFDSDIPKYAILSHRWESAKKEIGFQEFEVLIKEKGRRSMSKSKIGRVCSLARAHDFDWVWVDTCCIDKRSSAELTEAINSMYRWYKQAERCYVYFNDVEWNADDLDDSRSQLRSSQWFTRGWTLQELLAPRSLVCYDKQWTSFGDRDSLADDIIAATRISKNHLNGTQDACVAVKMSWAAYRKTSRIEDMAYCLLGFFDINMPMLYGEGRNAFLRLQRKLIKKTNDESIFAWTDIEIAIPHGMLAPWPSAFAASGGTITTTDPGMAAIRRPYTITNRGLELYVGAPTTVEMETIETLVFGLNCEKEYAADREDKFFAIMLQRFGNHWLRVNCNIGCLRRSKVETKFQAKDGK